MTEVPNSEFLIQQSLLNPVQNYEGMDENEKFIWYILAPGSTTIEGPFSAREIDVKFRTNDITSHYHAWKEGMKEWKKIFEVDELKVKLIESKSEVLEEVVQEYMKKMSNTGKTDKDKPKGAIESDEDEPIEKEVQDSDLCYFSKAEKKYKVFNPSDKKWTAQDDKPSPQQLEDLKKICEEQKKEEDKLVQQIHHDIAGEEDANASLNNHPLSANDIASQAAQSVLHRMSSDKKENPNGEGDGVDDGSKQDVKPMSVEEVKLKEAKKLKKKRYLENKKKKWYQSKVNTYIYIQDLPNDITEQELKDYFVRCGVIRLDPYNGKEQIRIYTDDDGVPKGDARIGYAMEESVDMAVEMLNDTEIRPGCKIRVQQAEFQQKGQDYVPRKKQKIDKLEQLRIKAEQERQLAWDDDYHAMHQLGLHIVILEQMYTQEELAFNADRVDFFFEELEIELRGEIEASIGPIEKVTFFKENPLGIVKIRFASSLHADECIKVMDGRFFDGRQIKAHYWDGKTDYRIVRESADEFDRRVDDFGQWLEQEAAEQEHIQEGQKQQEEELDKDRTQADGEQQ